MVVTTVLSILVTIPVAQRYAQARVQEVTANHKARPGEMAASVMNSAIYPSLAAVFGSFMLGALAGIVVGGLLPRSVPTTRRYRRADEA